MFDQIEIRRAKNGFVIAVHTEEGVEEFVFDSTRKTLKFVKEFVEANVAKSGE